MTESGFLVIFLVAGIFVGVCDRGVCFWFVVLLWEILWEIDRIALCSWSEIGSCCLEGAPTPWFGARLWRLTGWMRN